jgi:fatty-acyl-CoA synthase
MYPIEFFWRAASRHPDRIALIHPGGTVDYRTLARKVGERATHLIAIDPTLGSLVCVGAANRVDHLVTILAVLAAGKVWVPLNPRNGDPELKRIVDFVDDALVVADRSMIDRLAGLGTTPHAIEAMVGDAAGAGTSDLPMGQRPSLAIALDQTQAVKFTGGTTGAPKGVLQPLRAWNTNIVTQSHHLALTPQDRYLVAAPLTHGTSTYMLPLLANGGALIFPEEAKPAGLLDAAERHGATLFFSPPTLILALADEQRHAPRDLASLRCIVYGGAPMRPEQIRSSQAVFGDVICTCYGQTEAPQMIAFLAPNDMRGGDLAAVGFPTLMTQVAILDGEGAAVPVGTPGEIAVRGDLVMTGYMKAEAETRKVFVGGWLKTGDGGSIDERGCLFLGDRIRDVIISGGFNVYPSDVETVLTQHPAVADCSVVGIPDAKWGEAVQAAVKIRKDYPLDLAEMTAFLKRELGSVKAPKEIHVFEDLPRSPVGKVLKSAIRDEIARRRG